MKFIHDQFEKLRPLFSKGGKLEKLHALFEAQETFLFVLPQRTTKGAHIRDALDTKRLMTMVIVALLPALLFGMWNVGYQFYAAQGPQARAAAGLLDCFLKGAWYVVPIIIVSYAAGGFWEVLFAVVRKHEINEGFLVTGMLLPLIVPPTIPLWQVAVGISFGVVIGKEVFGGTGMNVFNPALVARAFLFFAYAGQMSGEVWTVLPAKDMLVDGYSGATPLSVAALNPSGPAVTALTDFAANHGGAVDYSWLSMFLGTIPGSIGETSTLAILIGAAILIATGIGSWRIMLSSVVGMVVMVCIVNAFGAGAVNARTLPAHFHLVMGGFAFATVFMATDPVSASATNTGKYIYGALIGVMTVLIRCFNPAYPEGAMLAVLFLNAFAPLIDYVVVNRHMARRLRRAEA